MWGKGGSTERAGDDWVAESAPVGSLGEREEERAWAGGEQGDNADVYEHRCRGHVFAVCYYIGF